MLQKWLERWTSTRSELQIDQYNLNTVSSPPTVAKPDRSTILDHINNDNLQGAFDLLDLVDFGNFRGSYIQFKKDFVDMPVGGNRAGLRERLAVFIKMHMK